jgi:isoleucyl-tRNA synthetase
MANLGDFNPDTDCVALEDMLDIDRWALSRLEALIEEVRAAYDGYSFHLVYHAINNFCTDDMSKLYIDITKDRVYVENPTSKARRSAQTALYYVISALVKMIAPILAFTAEEMWQAIPHAESDTKESVYLNDMPAFDLALTYAEIRERWDSLFEMRDDVMKALELARAEKMVGKSLEAKITVYTENKEKMEILESFGKELSTVFIVSGVSLVSGPAANGAHTEEGSDLSVLVQGADGCKCDRCWSYSEQGISTEDGGFLCERCRKILAL